ncbi:MAG: hypothetical protein QOE40_1756 [Actinomycetota bacterium]|nr:hypothetical protein [Actinomycetota bacterium]
MTDMPAPGSVSSPRRDASMSLLTNLMDHSLDEGYAEAARRRDPSGSRRTGGWVLLAGLLAVGLLLSTAAAQARNRASSVKQASSALAAEITSRTESNDRIDARLERERATVATQRQDVLRLTEEGSALAASLTPLEAATGVTPVRGPAVVVHLKDAPAGDATDPDADPRTAGTSDGRITDRDLQTIVNEVWAAGAEAISVNGQRLTSLSAIRSAGDAILVDFRPLSPPYDVVGIGDKDALRTRFLEGFGGSYLQALRAYGIDYSLATRDSARLDASSGVALRYAQVPPTGPTASSNPTESPS